MTNLPWDLDLFERVAEGLDCATAYDPATGILTANLTNTTSAAIVSGAVTLFADIDMPAGGGSMWIHGRYMQMDALVRRFGEPAEDGYDGRYRRAGDDFVALLSREVATITLPSMPTPTLIAGSLRPDRFFLDVELRLDTEEREALRLSLIFELEGTILAPGESLELPPVVLAQGRDSVALMERYATMVAEAMSARVPDHVPTGWCSWYYFYNRVTEADIRKNLHAMRATGHPAEYVQIDDGYQSHTGDWLIPNEKFPSGMAALAAEIRDAGYKPGLWLAPFVLHEDSAALRDHPEMVLHTHDGETVFVQTWLGRCAILDATHPGAAEWLRHLTRTVVHDWGYEYLKLDAISFAARSSAHVRYHAPGATGPDNIRRGLEVIREAAGDLTFILGCTCHFGPAIGLVDAMRVGPDVKELWADGPSPSVRHAMRLTLQRNWMHNRWWANDPDCLIVRDTDTQLTEAEVRFLATGIALSGGMVVASDDLPKLPPDRRELALALFPPSGVAARPVDPAEGPVASAWRARLGEGRSLVGILNWTDEPTWVAPHAYLEPGEVAFDIFNGRVLRGGDLYLRPHEGSLWQVTAPGPTPRVVGDTGHIDYHDLHRRHVSGQVHVRNDSARPRTIAIESRGRIVTEELLPGELRRYV